MKKPVKIAIILSIIAVIIAISAIVGTSVYRSSPGYLLSAAERYLTEMNYEEAIIAFEKYLKIEPKDSEARLKLADAYYKLGELEEAIDVLEEGTDLSEDRKLRKKLDEYNKEKNPPAETTAVTREELPETTATTTAATTTAAITTTTATTTAITTTTTTTVPPEEPQEAVYSATPFFGTFDNPNGTESEYYVTKTVGDRTEIVRRSEYPMVVSKDGYIVYYEYRDESFAVIRMVSPTGEIVSEVTVYGGEGYNDPMYIGFGIYQDRLWTSFRGDYAYYETKSYLYILGKDGSVVKSSDFGVDSSVYWAAYIEGVGCLSYAYGGGYSNTSGKTYFYIPETGTVYEDIFPGKISSGGNEYTKLFSLTRNYETYVIVSYVRLGADFGIDGEPLNPEDCLYCIGNVANGKYTKLYKSIETEDGITFKAVTTGGKTVYINADGEKVG